MTAFRVKYNITKYNYSSIKIDQLRMTGGMYKPFDGSWANSKRDVDWRWHYDRGIRGDIVVMVVTRQPGIRRPLRSPEYGRVAVHTMTVWRMFSPYTLLRRPGILAS